MNGCGGTHLRWRSPFGYPAEQPAVDREGRSTFVKFHWKPRQGLQSVLWNEALKINGADPDFHRRDLWDAIERGDFPQWDLGVQLFDEETAAGLPFDHLDATAKRVSRGDLSPLETQSMPTAEMEQLQTTVASMITNLQNARASIAAQVDD